MTKKNDELLAQAEQHRDAVVKKIEFEFTELLHKFRFNPDLPTEDLAKALLHFLKEAEYFDYAN